MSGGPDGPVPQRSLASLRAATDGPRSELAKIIPRRPRVSWWLGVVFALGFAFVVTPTLTADRWLAALGAGVVKDKQIAPLTVRVPALSGFTTADGGHIGNGGVLIARGEQATADDEHNAQLIAAAAPRGALPYVALFMLSFVLAAIFTHHMRRSTRGRLVRVQVVSLVSIAVLAIAVKVMLLMTSVSVLVVPVALLAMIPTLALDRVVGLATGILGALTVALLGPFDVGVAIILLVQAAIAGLVVAEQPKDRVRAVVTAGVVTTLFTAATYVLLTYLTTGRLPTLRDPLHSAWFAAAVGPAIATLLAVPLLPIYQMLVGEITRGKLIELEDLSNPLLKQIAEKAPGTWQHSLMMANMAEIAANAIGASGRLVRVGAYYHDLGKSLQPKYFIENLDPGETSPHDQLPPEVSCDAIFAHVTEGLVAARKAGLHERIVDFMHMHHGNGVLEYFWGKTKEIGNPRGLSVEQFRYPGHPPQSRETAILAICDAVEAASRTLKKPDTQSIDSLVQRIVYGKLHLGQLDESGLSMSDLRRISDSLKDTIRHANHGRIEYPWQKAQQDASASKDAEPLVSTSPRLDSLDRSPAQRDTSVKSGPASTSISAQTTNEVALAETKPARPEKMDVDPITTTAPVARETKPGMVAERGKPASVPPPVPERSKPPSSPPIDLVQRRTSSKPPPIKVEEVALADIAKSARKGPTQPPPDGIITSATFGEAAPAARKRAATLPPMLNRRAPTVPPPAAPGRRSSPTIPPVPGLEHRTAGPPSPVDLENAVTNPPPLRAGSPISRLPPFILEERPTATPHEDVTVPAMKLEPRELLDRAPTDDESRRTLPNLQAPAPATDDAGKTAPSFPKIEEAARTEPSMPKFDAASEPGTKTPGLAARIDAKLDGDEWSTETPIKAPTAAELRALLGQPDVTKQQSIAELERLSAQSRAREQAEEDARPEILSRRHPMPTAEVHDDDIEAAIELAPPARRPNAIAVAKQKKSE
ncbi:MAG: HDIG domain-containing protein [Deltaproteobacteria bacterium]|nr:HDIG domain-containing protein [Deltaproteobacteria bacterium]